MATVAAVIVMVASLTAGVLGLPFPEEEEILPVDAGDTDSPSVATSAEDSEDKQSVSAEVGSLMEELGKYFFGSPRNETGKFNCRDPLSTTGHHGETIRISATNSCIHTIVDLKRSS